MNKLQCVCWAHNLVSSVHPVGLTFYNHHHEGRQEDVMNEATNLDSEDRSFTRLCSFASSTTHWLHNLEASYFPSLCLSFLVLKMKGLN